MALAPRERKVLAVLQDYGARFGRDKVYPAVATVGRAAGYGRWSAQVAMGNLRRLALIRPIGKKSRGVVRYWVAGVERAPRPVFLAGRSHTTERSRCTARSWQERDLGSQQDPGKRAALRASRARRTKSKTPFMEPRKALQAVAYHDHDQGLPIGEMRENLKIAFAKIYQRPMTVADVEMIDAVLNGVLGHADTRAREAQGYTRRERASETRYVPSQYGRVGHHEPVRREVAMRQDTLTRPLEFDAPPDPPAPQAAPEPAPVEDGDYAEALMERVTRELRASAAAAAAAPPVAVKTLPPARDELVRYVPPDHCPPPMDFRARVELARLAKSSQVGEKAETSCPDVAPPSSETPNAQSP